MTEENTPSQPSRSSGKEVESNVLLATKNLRWFIKKGSTTSYIEGFTSKVKAFQWIDINANLNWSSGGFFQIYGESTTWQIVDRKGNLLS